MIALALGQRLLLAGAAVPVGTGLLAFPILLAGGTVPTWLLPVVVLAAVALPWRIDRVAPAAPPAPRWLVAVAVALLLAVGAALAWGSVATPSRHWDGAVAWQPKADYLADALTLEQPFFTDPAVLAHSRDYPLLQPLLIAAGEQLLGDGRGRLLFPALWLLLVVAVGVPLRRAGVAGSVAWLAALGAGLVPMLVNPTSGGADSGYAELTLLAAVTVAAGGLAAGDGRLVALGAAMAVMTKPEGLGYGAVIAATCFAVGARRLLAAALCGWLGGAAVWLPLQHDLQHFGAGGRLALFLPALAGLFAAAWAAEVVAARRRLGRRGRVLALAVVAPLALAALPLLVLAGGNDGGTIGVYLADLGRVLRRLQRLPTVLAGMGEYAFVRGGFALAFWLPVLLLLAARGRARPPAGTVLLALGLGLLVLLAPFLLSPEEDVRHHLRSSMPRLLLHWVGAAMLAAGLLAQQNLDRAVADVRGQGNN